MPQSFGQFLAKMDRYSDRVPLDVLTREMADLRMTFDEIAEFAEFGAKTYRRNLVHAGPAFQALILCWRAGQRSPLHDHRGSSCGVKVVKGAATETFFERTPEGLVYATGSRVLPEGAVCGSQDDDIHQVSNLQCGGADLVTLHVYSPPLLNMRIYSLTDTTVADFNDPVHEFAHGAGI